MPDVLMFADTFRSPELRHEVPLGIPDPFLYAERDGVRHIQISSMEVPRLAALGLFELHPSEEFGSDELIACGPLVPRDSRARWSRARCKSLGVTSAVVPETFPLWLADRLRADGVELVADAELLRRAAAGEDRRRARRDAPGPARRRGGDGHRARPAAPRDARTGRACVLDGEPLTVERVKSAMSQAFAAHGATADEFIVAPGAQGSGRPRHGIGARFAPASRSSSTSGRATTSRSSTAT